MSYSVDSMLRCFPLSASVSKRTFLCPQFKVAFNVAPNSSNSTTGQNPPAIQSDIRKTIIERGDGVCLYIMYIESVLALFKWRY